MGLIDKLLSKFISRAEVSRTGPVTTIQPLETAGVRSSAQVSDIGSPSPERFAARHTASETSERCIMWRSFKTKVAGVTFENPDGSERQEILSRCSPGEVIILQRDHNNPHSKYAIAVLRKNNEQLGFIPEDVAFRHEGMNDLAPHLDKDGEVKAHIVDITGGGGFKHRGCVIKIEIGDVPYKVKEQEARELRECAKKFELSEPNRAIALYKQCIIKLLETDTLIRKTYAFKKQTIDIGSDPGTWRRTSFPIERITAILEKSERYSDCLRVIETYERATDRKGLSKTDLNTIAKRKSRILVIVHRGMPADKRR